MKITLVFAEATCRITLNAWHSYVSTQMLGAAGTDNNAIV